MRSPQILTPLFLALGLFTTSSSSVLAQTGEYHNTKQTINGSYASAFTTFAIGPNADITINGDWYITANSVTIDPAAKIGGTGTLHLMTPKTYSATATAAATTLTAGGIMGNSAGITCKVSLENGAGIVLAGNKDLVMGNTLAFAKADAHLTLGANAGLAFTAAATALPTITNVPAVPAFARQDVNNTTFADAYVVTNGAGSVSKAGVANAASFTFPVGFSRNSGLTTDYTPAVVTNNAASRNIQVRVQDYTTSTPVEGNASKGTNRTWQIQGSAAGNATLALTHNAGTEGNAYARNAAFITQNTTAGGWSTDTPAAAANFTNTALFQVPATTDGSYFAKSSDAINSLNPFIALSSKVLLQGAYNGSTMTTTLRAANLIPTSQPYNLAPFNYAGTEVAVNKPDSATDWVLVELRNATTPASVVATRAGIIMNDGTITEADGISPLAFRNTAPGSYFVAIRHRNHLDIRSAGTQVFTQDATTAYDFTTSQSKAYQNSAYTANNDAQAALAGSKFGMWGGNANSNSSTRFTGLANDAMAILTALGGNQNAVLTSVYNSADINMDGGIQYTGLNSDASFLMSVLSGNQTAVKMQH